MVQGTGDINRSTLCWVLIAATTNDRDWWWRYYYGSTDRECTGFLSQRFTCDWRMMGDCDCVLDSPHTRAGRPRVRAYMEITPTIFTVSTTERPHHDLQCQMGYTKSSTQLNSAQSARSQSTPYLHSHRGQMTWACGSGRWDPHPDEARVTTAANRIPFHSWNTDKLLQEYYLPSKRTLCLMTLLL